jgi:hypothetical protein
VHDAERVALMTQDWATTMSEVHPDFRADFKNSKNGHYGTLYGCMCASEEKLEKAEDIMRGQAVMWDEPTDVDEEKDGRIGDLFSD